jgi:hypothetical protein
VVECLLCKCEAPNLNPSPTIKQKQISAYCQKCSMPIIVALGRLRQDDPEFEASLGYKQDPVSKKKKKINMYSYTYGLH